MPDPAPFDEARARELAAIPTRLAGLSTADIEDLIRWGSAICDTALRSYVTVPQG